MKVLVLAFVAIVVAVSAVPHRQWRTNREGTRDEECQASAVQIAYSNGNLIISWTIATCATVDHYKVSLTIDGKSESLSQLAPGVPIAQYPMDTPSCEQISAVVESYGGDPVGVIATTEPKHLQLSLHDIEGVGHKQHDNGVTISWTALALPETCTVQYSITMDGEPPSPVSATSYEIPKDKLKTCELTKLTIEAESNGIKSDKQPYEFTTQMPAVELTKVVNTAEGIEIDFKPLGPVSDACGSVTYKVVEKEGECFESSYGVFAVTEQNELGLEISKEIGKKPTAVNNLQADIRGNEIQLQWKPPTGGEECNLEYIGKYGNGDPSDPVHSTSLTFKYNTDACTVDEIEVWAISKGLEGDISKISIVGTFGKVIGLTCSLVTGTTTVNCEWKKPDGCADNTSMLYEITYYDGDKTKTLTQADFTLEFSTTSCSSSWVSVTPQLSDSATGDALEVKVAGCTY